MNNLLKTVILAALIACPLSSNAGWKVANPTPTPPKTPPPASPGTPPHPPATLPVPVDPEAETRIRSMQPVFESVINCISDPESGWNGNYSAKDPRFMWTILYYFATTNADLHSLVEQNESMMLVPRRVMQEFATSLFADYNDLLPIPAGIDFIKYDNDWDRYNVQMSDAGAAVFNVAAIDPIAGGKYRVKVIMLDEEEAIVYGTYIFIMAPNEYSRMIDKPLYYYSVESVKIQN